MFCEDCHCVCCCNLRFVPWIYLVFRVFIHYYLHRRSVLMKLTENIASTAKKAAEPLASTAKQVTGAVLTVPTAVKSSSASHDLGKSASSLSSSARAAPSAAVSGFAALVKKASDIVPDSQEDLYSAAAYKQKEAIQRVVDDNSFDAIIASNKAGIILNVNNQAVKEFGYKSGSDLVDKKVSVLFHDIEGSPEKLAENEGKQIVETLTRENGTSMKCIIASRSIAGASDCVVTYVRSLETIHGQL